MELPGGYRCPCTHGRSRKVPNQDSNVSLNIAGNLTEFCLFKARNQIADSQSLVILLQGSGRNIVSLSRHIPSFADSCLSKQSHASSGSSRIPQKHGRRLDDGDFVFLAIGPSVRRSEVVNSSTVVVESPDADDVLFATDVNIAPSGIGSGYFLSQGPSQASQHQSERPRKPKCTSPWHAVFKR